ncbi:hypothetical protein CHS0354_026606 [Potamilus streckersoni]|uniref:Uncharacterized protein n=1 Tax=Potamilus streckersoni TaxID=2493646 RepID=A0AAE0SU58_9BIVA|nr:hypothetical protein CHS0354_026606 [Potamilus streckersoni]
MIRSIIQRLPTYMDIGHIRTIKVTMVLMGTSWVLQMITFTMPGWRVQKNVTSGFVDYMALMYDERCNNDGCKTYPISEDEDKKVFLFHFITWIIDGLVPLLFSSLTLFLLYMSIKKPKWRGPFFLICTWSLGIAMILQWDLVATFAELHRISHLPPFTMEGYIFPVPWNVILHSFSAFLTTIVMLVPFVLLMKQLILNATPLGNMQELEEQDMTSIEDFDTESLA